MIKLVDVEKTYFSKAGDIAALKKCLWTDRS